MSVPWTMATVPITLTSMGPNSIDSSFDAPDLTMLRKSCFVAFAPSRPMPTQSSAMIWLSLPRSFAYCAADHSRSNCLTVSAAPEAAGLFDSPNAGLKLAHASRTTPITLVIQKLLFDLGTAIIP